MSIKIKHRDDQRMAPLAAAVTRVNDTQALKTRWTDLADRLGAPFFLSWDWIATAVETASAPVYVAEITDAQGLICGLGLFCAVTEKRHGILRIRQLRLNETGAAASALVPIEYNTLLIAPENEQAGWRAVMKALANSTIAWDELVITNGLLDLENQLASGEAFLHRRAEHPSAYVDLQTLRESKRVTLEGYIDSLGRSTRSQLRRAFRLYTERGSVELTRAGSLDQAHEFFEALCDLHEAKWRALEKPGLRSQEHFYRFHQKLITRCFQNGGVELLCASAGDTPIGYLYNFIDGPAVRFNAGGFVPEKDNRFKPGLVTQALAIADHLAKSADIYDFMAGSDRYKLNLGQAGPALTSFALQRPSPLLRLEAAGRRLKRFAEKTSSSNQRSAADA